MSDASTVIPAIVHMISGCQDKQTSADVYNVDAFDLPDPVGRAGGACTSALLKVLYYGQAHKLSWVDVLMNMRGILSEESFSQIPQLTSSRPLDVTESFYIVPPEDFEGTRRALLIGINYTGQQGELSGCLNDVNNMRDYLVEKLGFKEKNITMLTDDTDTKPTGSNIIGAFEDLVSKSKSGDAVYFHYSGHGGKVLDQNGDESDGYDETLIPLDYRTYGQIRDDVLYKKLVGALRKNVTLTAVMDCCHSGTVLDLPYKYKADGVSTEMQFDDTVDMTQLEQYNADLDLQGQWLKPSCGLVVLAAILAIIIWFIVK